MTFQIQTQHGRGRCGVGLTQLSGIGIESTDALFYSLSQFLHFYPPAGCVSFLIALTKCQKEAIEGFIWLMG